MRLFISLKTIFNTGFKGGIITHIEKLLNRPLQWNICLLHFNELPLKHVIRKLCGRAVGPNNFCGPFTDELKNCENKAVLENFEIITCEFPEITKKDLSSDQKYLWEIAHAVSSGVCPASLAAKVPGNMSLSRWLNTASRFLRLFITKDKPNKNLRTIVMFIMKVYVPLWFQIKKRKRCIYGSVHLFNFIKMSRYLDSNILSVVDEVVKTNGYYAHSENILLAMLADKDIEIRKKAVEKIKQIRSLKNNEKNNENIRLFKVPKINFLATTYTEMINWDENVTEPPCTLHIKNEDLQIFVDNRLKNHEIFQFPCHTQVVERCIKVVSKTSSKVCNEESREGYIHNVFNAYQIMPKFDCKKQFKK